MARSFKSDCRGQVIVVTALLVAVILLTTAMYVIETQKNTPTVQSDDGVLIDSYQTSIRNTAVSALANFSSGGGNSDVLNSDLSQLRSVILAHSYRSQLSLTCSLLESGGYSNGLCVSWGSSGEGVSSAYATITCNSNSYSGSSEVTYIVNVTGRIQLSGQYIQLNDTLKLVNLSVNLFDERGGALADTFIISYFNASNWVAVDSSSISSNGDGTYALSFYAQTGQIGESLDVSVICLDTRGISVGATVTCSRVT